jgi:ferrochelatase
LTRELGKILDVPVWLAMRYGKPSIDSALEKVRESGVTDLTVVPLYPQYFMSATESSVVQINKLLKQNGMSDVTVDFLPAFYNQDSYLDAVAEISKPYLDEFAPIKCSSAFTVCQSGM